MTVTFRWTAGLAALGGALLLASSPATAFAQDGACYSRAESAEAAARPSPLDSTSVALESGTVKVCYGSPSARGRDVMGGLVPFGETWRTGANEATTIRVPVAATIGDVEVEAGWYSIYTIPGESEWTVVINGSPERWGIPINGEVRATDVGSTVVAVEETEGEVESLTMRLDASGGDSADLVIAWERTRIRVPVTLGD